MDPGGRLNLPAAGSLRTRPLDYHFSPLSGAVPYAPFLQRQTVWLRAVDEARLDAVIVAAVFLLLGALLGLVGTMLSAIIKERVHAGVP